MRTLVILSAHSEGIDRHSQQALAVMQSLSPRVDTLLVHPKASQWMKQMRWAVETAFVVNTQYYPSQAARKAFIALIRQRRYTHIVMSEVHPARDLLLSAAAHFDVSPLTNVIDGKGPYDWLQTDEDMGQACWVNNRDPKIFLRFHPKYRVQKTPIQGHYDLVSLTAVLPESGDFKVLNKTALTGERLDYDADRVIVLGDEIDIATHANAIMALAVQWGAAIAVTPEAYKAQSVASAYPILGASGVPLCAKQCLSIGLGAEVRLEMLSACQHHYAIHHDGDAEIFEQADYGWVSPYDEALSQILSALH